MSVITVELREIPGLIRALEALDGRKKVVKVGRGDGAHYETVAEPYVFHEKLPYRIGRTLGRLQRCPEKVEHDEGVEKDAEAVVAKREALQVKHGEGDDRTLPFEQQVELNAFLRKKNAAIAKAERQRVEIDVFRIPRTWLCEAENKKNGTPVPGSVIAALGDLVYDDEEEETQTEG